MTNSLTKKIYAAFRVLDAPIELLAIIGSIGDTLSDAECESLLDEWIMTGEYLHPVKDKE